MGIKSPSGTYIGLICIALVWLLPIGIIASGGTAGEIAAKASSFFGQPVQEPLSDPLPNPLQPLIWENLKRGEHCLRYKTREYTAKSVGQNRGPAAMEECRRSRAQIHDIELRPTFCENLGTWSGIWGHWVVDFDEPDCETSWTTFEDQGCQVTTGSHRFTAKLDRWNRKDNWLIMCSTTPAEHTLHEKKLPVPSRCERVKDVVIGTWDVPDRSCLPVSTPAS
ncbi:hypothetical protein P691DRAFT_244828 [Macrolepiota fuliginosa MF-IS2]|uniref:Uncharacterized protein n=1 Tax=Macrolepiota fuliginosa MF-IS2 TaxID=1400762 RepID=A0A9P5X9E9_9AGAR|nr:hypothetical protein P691DRAFT_244828 [Macrolepiota fuliginosa MF-IS2]